MSAKEQAHESGKASAPPKSAKSVTENLDGLVEQPTSLAAVSQRARLDPKSLSPANVLQLQRTIGNRAFGKLLAGAKARPVVQAKLTADAANDRSEQTVASGRVSSGAPKAVVQRAITDDDDLPLLQTVVESYEGDEQDEIRAILVRLYYGKDAADIALSELEGALYDLSESDDAIGELVTSGVDFSAIVAELSRLHETHSETATRREEIAEELARVASEKQKEALKKAEKEKAQKERASKDQQRADILSVIADYAGTGAAALKTIVQNGLASAEGIDKTLTSGLTMSADELKALKTAWRRLGDNTSGTQQGTVDLTPVTMWSPGANGDVGKKKVRAGVIDHNVNFIFRIAYAEGGSAEFNIHVDVARADWID